MLIHNYADKPDEMLSLAYAVLLLLAAASVGATGEADIKSETAKSPKYHAYVSQSTSNSGKCVQQVMVKGRGIDDKLEGDCSTNDVISVIESEKILIVGEPDKDSIVLFSNLPSNLMVIQKDECERIKYTSSGNTKTVLTNNDCNRIRKRVTDLLNRNGELIQHMSIKPPKKGSATPPTPENAKPIKPEDAKPPKPEQSAKPSVTVKKPDPDSWVSDPDGLDNDGVNDIPRVSTSTSKFNDKCTLFVTVKGLGIADRLKGPCLQNEPKVYLSATTLIFGDINVDNVVLFSDERSTLYVIRDKETCTKQVYTTSGKTTVIKPSPVSSDDCKTVKKRVEENVAKAKANPKQWTSNDPAILSQKFPSSLGSFGSASSPPAVGPVDSFTVPPGVMYGSRAYWKLYAEWQRKRALQIKQQALQQAMNQQQAFQQSMQQFLN